MVHTATAAPSAAHPPFPSLCSRPNTPSALPLPPPNLTCSRRSASSLAPLSPAAASRRPCASGGVAGPARPNGDGPLPPAASPARPTPPPVRSGAASAGPWSGASAAMRSRHSAMRSRHSAAAAHAAVTPGTSRSASCGVAGLQGKAGAGKRAHCTHSSRQGWHDVASVVGWQVMKPYACSRPCPSPQEPGPLQVRTTHPLE